MKVRLTYSHTQSIVCESPAQKLSRRPSGAQENKLDPLLAERHAMRARITKAGIVTHMTMDYSTRIIYSNQRSGRRRIFRPRLSGGLVTTVKFLVRGMTGNSVIFAVLHNHVASVIVEASAVHVGINIASVLAEKEIVGVGLDVVVVVVVVTGVTPSKSLKEPRTLRAARRVSYWPVAASDFVLFPFFIEVNNAPRF